MRRRLTEPLPSRPRTLPVTRLGSGLRVPRASRSGHPAAWRASSDVMGFTMPRALTRIGNRSPLLVVFEAQAPSRPIWLEAARVYSGSVMPAAEYGGLAHRRHRLCRWTARSRLEMSQPLPVPNASGIWPGASSQCVERAAAEIGKEIDIRVGRRPSRIVGHKRPTRDRDRLPATVGEDRLDEARVRRAAALPGRAGTSAHVPSKVCTGLPGVDLCIPDVVDEHALWSRHVAYAVKAMRKGLRSPVAKIS